MSVDQRSLPPEPPARPTDRQAWEHLVRDTAERLCRHPIILTTLPRAAVADAVGLFWRHGYLEAWAVARDELQRRRSVVLTADRPRRFATRRDRTGLVLAIAAASVLAGYAAVAAIVGWLSYG